MHLSAILFAPRACIHRYESLTYRVNYIASLRPQIRRVDANTVTVDISFCVLFLKSTMMKYIIERSTNVEMAKWLDVFYKHLKRVSNRCAACL